MIKSFSELYDAAQTGIREKNDSPPRVGVIYPTEARFLEAVQKASDQRYITPCLIGPESEIKKSAASANVDINAFDLINIDEPEEAVRKAIEIAHENKVDFLLKGNIITRDFVNLIMTDDINFAGRKSVVSHIGLVETKRYPKLMFVTDGGVIPEPDTNQKIQIIQNAALLANKLGIDTPKAGLLAAVEAIYPAIPITMEEAAIAKMSDRGQIKNVLIDGPLSFDVAIDSEIARAKGIINSKVAGDTDIFAMPTIETANAFYKAMVMYAGASAAGIILGGNITIASSSTVDSAKNIFNSIVLGTYLSLN